METVEQIKQYRRVKSSIMTSKILEALEGLEKVESGETEIYVNGESEEIKKCCIEEKSKVKIKKLSE